MNFSVVIFDKIVHFLYWKVVHKKKEKKKVFHMRDGQCRFLSVCPLVCPRVRLVRFSSTFSTCSLGDKG